MICRRTLFTCIIGYIWLYTKWPLFIGYAGGLILGAFYAGKSMDPILLLVAPLLGGASAGIWNYLYCEGVFRDMTEWARIHTGQYDIIKD